MRNLKVCAALVVAFGCGLTLAQESPKEASLRAFADAVSAVAPVLGQQARMATKLLQNKCGSTPSIQMVRAVLQQPEMMPTPLDPKTSELALAPAVAKVGCE